MFEKRTTNRHLVKQQHQIVAKIHSSIAVVNSNVINEIFDRKNHIMNIL